MHRRTEGNPFFVAELLRQLIEAGVEIGGAGAGVLAELGPLLGDPGRLAAMGKAARASGHADADERLARLRRRAP